MTNVLCPREQPEVSFVERFGNGPYILEVGCGQGAYTLALGRMYPGHTVLGVDIKGARIWFGAVQGRDEHLTNVGFVREQVELLGSAIPAHSVDDIWVTFPDPYLQERREHKRLTSERYMTLYRNLLAPSGKVRLKTDSLPLFRYTCQEWTRLGVTITAHIEDVHNGVHQESPLIDLLRTVKTPYEIAHIADGRTIYYVEGVF